jgi:hypothetical protein
VVSVFTETYAMAMEAKQVVDDQVLARTEPQGTA